MSLNISQTIDNKTTEIAARLANVNNKIKTATTTRQTLIKKRDNLIEMLKKLKAIEIQSTGFDAMDVMEKK